MSWREPYPWAVAVAVCAAVAVWGRHPGRMAFHWLFKPLTTVLLTTVAFLMLPHGPAREWVLLALLFSLAGDVVLMGPDRWFAAGLGSFLVALICYTVAFTHQIPFAPRQLVYLILPAAVGALILRGLWPSLGKLRWAVAVYAAALAVMAWRALSRFDALDLSLRAWAYGCLGAALFMTGDTLLARNRFLGKRAPYGVELGAYFAAQWCLIASMW